MQGVNFFMNLLATRARKMIIILFLFFLTGFTYLIFSAGKEPLSRVLPSCRGCNIILISIDTLGAKHMGMYGYERNTTPVLDDFFTKRGIIMDNTFAPAPWTLPSHAALFSSQMPSALHVETQLDRIAPTTLLLPEVFKSYGWETQGLVTESFVRTRWGFAKGFDSFLEIPDWQNAKTILSGATTWVKEKRSNPFFLFLHTFQVHDPHDAPSPFNRVFEGSEEASRRIEIEDIEEANIHGWTEEEKNEYIRAYDQEVQYTDSLFENFLATLESEGLLKNTIIAITSDHGEEFGEHGVLGFHSYSLYDELIHVPFLLYIPGAVALRLEAPISLIDIGPMLLDLVGIPAQSSFNGQTLEDILSQPDKGLSRVVLSETTISRTMLFPGITKGYAMSRTIIPEVRTKELSGNRAIAARSKNWKLIKTMEGNIELYDMLTDKAELTNLFSEWSTMSQRKKEELLPLFKALHIPSP